MLPQELLQKVKRIELFIRKTVSDMLSGQYKSHFKGQGMQFSDHRVYLPGDDVRHLDWKVSARTREPLVKKFEEERELTVLILVDVSSSLIYSSEKKTKLEISAELAGMLAFAATQSGDKVGLLSFSETIEKIIPPKKGRSHVLKIIREVLRSTPAGRKTELGLALETADRLLKHSSIVFVISDFMTVGFEKALKKLNRRHDIRVLWIRDKNEAQLPKAGYFYYVDPESGQQGTTSTSYSTIQEYQKSVSQKDQALKELLKSQKVQFEEFFTHKDHGDVLVRFLQQQKKRA